MHFVARRVGLRFEERGMGSFGLGSGRRQFEAMAFSGGCEPPAAARGRVAKTAEQPLTLRYGWSNQRAGLAAMDAWNRDAAHISAAGSDGLRATLYLEHGVTLRTVEEHLRRFAREIEAFENNARKYAEILKSKRGL
jgi:hypothetical protein